MRRGIYLLTVALTALTMGLEFAHVLEWPQKQNYSGQLYVQLQESLYVWFGNLGSVIYVLAVLSTVVLAILLRRGPRGWLPGAAAAAEVIALVTFLTVVYPVNLRLPVGTGGAVPADWEALRFRWELGHAIGFALFAAAFAALVSTLLAGRSPVFAGRSPAIDEHL